MFISTKNNLLVSDSWETRAPRKKTVLFSKKESGKATPLTPHNKREKEGFCYLLEFDSRQKAIDYIRSTKSFDTAFVWDISKISALSESKRNELNDICLKYDTSIPSQNKPISSKLAKECARVGLDVFSSSDFWGLTDCPIVLDGVRLFDGWTGDGIMMAMKVNDDYAIIVDGTSAIIKKDDFKAVVLDIKPYVIYKLNEFDSSDFDCAILEQHKIADTKIAELVRKVDETPSGFFYISGNTPIPSKIPVEKQQTLPCSADFTWADDDTFMLGSPDCLYIVEDDPHEGLFFNVKTINDWISMAPVDWMGYKKIITTCDVPIIFPSERDGLIEEDLKAQMAISEMSDCFEYLKSTIQQAAKVCVFFPVDLQGAMTMSPFEIWKRFNISECIKKQRAVPDFEPLGKTIDLQGGSIGTERVGFFENCVHVDFESFYGSLFMLEAPDSNQNKAHILSIMDEKHNGGKSLKRLIVSFIGLLASADINPFSDTDLYSKITQKGREKIKEAIDWMKDRGLKLITYHTDGVLMSFDFAAMSYVYTGKNGSKHGGIHAFCAEYNEKHGDGALNLTVSDVYLSAIVLKGNNIASKSISNEIRLKGAFFKGKNNKPFINDFASQAAASILSGEKRSFFISIQQELRKIRNNKLRIKDLEYERGGVYRVVCGDSELEWKWIDLFKACDGVVLNREWLLGNMNLLEIVPSGYAPSNSCDHGSYVDGTGKVFAPVKYEEQQVRKIVSQAKQFSLASGTVKALVPVSNLIEFGLQYQNMRTRYSAPFYEKQFKEWLKFFNPVFGDTDGVDFFDEKLIHHGSPELTDVENN